MALWGTAHASASNKPKYLPNNKDSNYDVTACYADQSGWVMRAGSKATGNGNTDADPEILVAIRGLAGATATTGLKHPTITRSRWQDAAVTHAGGTNNLLKLDVTWDEQVKYTAGSAPTVAAKKDGSGSIACTLTHIDGKAISGTHHTGNTFTFTGSTTGTGTYTIANSTEMGNKATLTDAISTTALEDASVTLVTATLPGNCVAS